MSVLSDSIREAKRACLAARSTDALDTLIAGLPADSDAVLVARLARHDVAIVVDEVAEMEALGQVQAPRVPGPR